MFAGRCRPGLALRPGPPSHRKNPLSPLLPLDSVHSPVSPLFPLHTRNPGGGASPDKRRACPEPITNTIVTQQVSKVRRQLKYYLNCRHADILRWHSHSWLCSSQKPSTGAAACATTRSFGRYGLQPVRNKAPLIRYSHAGRCNRQDRLLARSASAGLLLPDRCSPIADRHSPLNLRVLRASVANSSSSPIAVRHLLLRRAFAGAPASVTMCAGIFQAGDPFAAAPCLFRSALQATGEEPS